MTNPALRNSASSRTNDNNNNKRQNGGHQQHNNKSKHSFTHEQTDCFLRTEDSSPTLPRITPLLVFGVTLAFRVAYVLDPQNWWMVHPDEVYQSVEVAHIEVYGFGFRPYDFSPEASPDKVTGYRQMELDAGMYALRSPIFPYFYVLVSWLVNNVGIQVNPYLLWRLAHVTMTSLLPLAVYTYASRLYRLQDKAHVATILVASSSHLTVLSTHCLLQSFLAPFTFLAMSLLVDINIHRSATLPDHQINPISPNSKEKSTTGLLNQENHNDIYTTSSVTNHKQLSKGTRKSNGLSCLYTKQEDDITNNTLLYPQNHQFRTDNKITIIKITSALFIATMTCYIRPDTFLIYVVNFIIFPEMKPSLRVANLLAVLFGVGGALAVGIGTDFIYYGRGISSCVNWTYFNVILGRSTLFGYMSSWFYFEKFFFHDVGILSLSVFAILGTIVLLWKHQIHKKLIDNKVNNNKALKTNPFTSNVLSYKSLLAWFIPLVAYSLNGHKETRFINDVMILVFIFIADFLVNLKHVFQSRATGNNLIRLIVMLFIATQWRSFPSNANNTHWVYQKTESVQDVNLCIKYISQQNDVTGVFYDSNLHMTGGMSLLHHDVPILSLVGNGFYEFGPETRQNVSRGNLSTPTRPPTIKPRPFETSTMSINEFTRASNYISVANAPAVVRIIIKKPVYNYLVLRRDRKFLEFGFVEVFATRHRRVLMRLLDVQSEYRLQGLLDKISMGTNSTVLLHEGDVLFNLNQFQEAAARFYQAVTLDDKLLEAYLPLHMCYNHLGEKKAANAVRGKCVSLFGEEACSKPRRLTPV